LGKIDDILKKYPYISDDVQKLQTELNKYIMLQNEARDPLKGQTLNGMPHTYEINDQTLQAVENIIDRYQAEIDECVKKINEILDLKKWLDKAFITLTEDERRLLYLMYDERFSIRRIGNIIKCGRYQAQKIIDEAKEKIKRIVA
jgi:DNA-directed RNA polymerase specialized sigma subunit